MEDLSNKGTRRCLIETLYPEIILTDFELAAMNAVRNMYVSINNVERL